MFKSFTIIIPCYNSELFINKALDSIVNSNYPKELIEVLIVNDGSQNESVFLETIQEFLQKYPSTFKYYKKQNGNWGSVINYVRDNNLISNDLVCILDSDDWVKPFFFEEINKKIKDADIFLGSFDLLNEKKKKILKVKPYLFCRTKPVVGLKKFTSLTFPGSTIYKKDIFISNIRLTEGHSYQDFPFFFNATKNCSKINWTKKSISCYWRDRPGNSMSGKWNDKKVNDWFVSFNELKKSKIEGQFFWVMLQKGCIKAFKKRNISLEIGEKPTFKWAPIWIRWVLHFYWFFSFKKIMSIKK